MRWAILGSYRTTRAAHELLNLRRRGAVYFCISFRVAFNRARDRPVRHKRSNRARGLRERLLGSPSSVAAPPRFQVNRCCRPSRERQWRRHSLLGNCLADFLLAFVC